MPEGKPAGVRCIHLDEALRCALFGDPRRPRACEQFQAEEWLCGSDRQQALDNLQALELHSLPP